MTTLLRIVVLTYGLAFIAFAGAVFATPTRAERFLLLFASSARAHYVEMTFRMVLGACLVALSPDMWPTMMVRLLGWAIVISSAALTLMPWRLHARFGERVRPMLIRWIKVYAVGAFAFGCLLLAGVFSRGSPSGP